MNYRIVVPRLERLKNVIAEIPSIHGEYIEAMRMLYKLEEGKFNTVTDQITTFIGFGYRLVRIANTIETRRNQTTDPNKRRALTQAIIDLLGCGLVSDYYDIFRKLPASWVSKHKRLGDAVYDLCTKARAARLKFGTQVAETTTFTIIANTVPAVVDPDNKLAIVRVDAENCERKYFVVDVKTLSPVCAAGHAPVSKNKLAYHLHAGVACPRCANGSKNE